MADVEPNALFKLFYSTALAFSSPIHRPAEFLHIFAVLTRRWGLVLAFEPSGAFFQRPVELLAFCAVLTCSMLVLAFEPSGAFFHRPAGTFHD